MEDRVFNSIFFSKNEEVVIILQREYMIHAFVLTRKALATYLFHLCIFENGLILPTLSIDFP